MLIDAFLRGLVVVRRDDEYRIRARAFRVCGKLDGLDRVIRARAGDHGDASLSRFDGQLNHPFVFLMRKRGALARGAARHEAA